jgi:hypothetical protein
MPKAHKPDLSADVSLAKLPTRSLVRVLHGTHVAIKECLDDAEQFRRRAEQVQEELMSRVGKIDAEARR